MLFLCNIKFNNFSVLSDSFHLGGTKQRPVGRKENLGRTKQSSVERIIISKAMP